MQFEINRRALLQRGLAAAVAASALGAPTVARARAGRPPAEVGSRRRDGYVALLLACGAATNEYLDGSRAARLGESLQATYDQLDEGERLNCVALLDAVDADGSFARRSPRDRVRALRSRAQQFGGDGAADGLMVRTAIEAFAPALLPDGVETDVLGLVLSGGDA